LKESTHGDEARSVPDGSWEERRDRQGRRSEAAEHASELEACPGDREVVSYQQGAQQQQPPVHKGLVKTITGAANNGSGLIRITATNHTFQTENRITITGVGGTTEANAVNWRITVITANTFDLQGSTFTNAYTSGGSAKRTQG
jgi:hypothetical protein